MCESRYLYIKTTGKSLGFMDFFHSLKDVVIRRMAAQNIICTNIIKILKFFQTSSNDS